MLIKKICCPSCDANIRIDEGEHSTLFCPYCGCQLSIDNNETIYTKNININKKIEYIETYNDRAAVKREKRLARESKSADITMIILFLILIGSFIFLFSFGSEMDKKKQEAIDAGKIQIGISKSDMLDKNYKAIVEQLTATGFTNITTIELDDAGWFSNKEDTIASVTVNGDAHFSLSEYYYPDAKIVITYH